VDKTRAAAGTFLFLFPAPGVVAGVVPWLLTGWEMDESWWLAVWPARSSWSPAWSSS
jgi:hypothetical protein